MAVATIDQLIAGLNTQKLRLIHKVGATGIANIPISQFRIRGTPGAAAAPASGLTGAALVSPALGQIPFTNPAVGNKYLGPTFASCSSATSLLLVDFLWQNSGIVVTTLTAQTINSVTWPARDVAATTNGDGVIVALECITANTNAGAIAGITISYTNQAGTAGRTGTIAQSWPINCPINSIIPFTLQAGDSGVRSVQSITLGTSLVTGSVSLVAYRPIQLISLPAGIGGNEDVIQNGMPQLFNGTVLSTILIPVAATAIVSYLTVGFTEG